jgi:GNAT superfamily N-acetyltransferase
VLQLPGGFTALTVAERPELTDEAEPIVLASWPEFMFHDPASDTLWGRLAQDEPGHQYGLLDPDGVLVGLGNSVPVPWLRGEELPPRGWRWALTEGFAARDAGTARTSVSALAIQTDPGRRGQGLARLMVEAMRRITADAGFADLVAPVRPNKKCDYPLVPMADYLTWTTPDGLPWDPWIRVHVRAGATIVGPCEESMEVPGSVADWEAWGGVPLPGSGTHVVPGALAPLHVDVGADRAVYVEPNVWLHHPLG